MLYFSVQVPFSLPFDSLLLAKYPLDIPISPFKGTQGFHFMFHFLVQLILPKTQTLATGYPLSTKATLLSCATEKIGHRVSSHGSQWFRVKGFRVHFEWGLLVALGSRA